MAGSCRGVGGANGENQPPCPLGEAVAESSHPKRFKRFRARSVAALARRREVLRERLRRLRECLHVFSESKGCGVSREISPLAARSISRPEETNVSLREEIVMATFNCRTLRAEVRQQELVRFLESKKIDCLAIQEHRIAVSSDPNQAAEVQLGAGWVLVHLSAWHRSVGGVGLILSPRSFQQI